MGFDLIHCHYSVSLLKHSTSGFDLIRSSSSSYRIPSIFKQLCIAGCPSPSRLVSPELFRSHGLKASNSRDLAPI
jgi:hypothetical protein